MRIIASQCAALRANEAEAAQTTARRVAEQFEGYLANRQELAVKHQTMPELAASTLGMSFTGEIEALELLRALTSGMPYLRDSGFIHLSSTENIAYLTSGKYELPYYTRRTLSMEENALLARILSMEQAAFLPWNAEKHQMLYLYPEKNVIRLGIDRIGLFVVSRSGLLAALDGFLADGSMLDSITDAAGQRICESEDTVSARIWTGDGREDRIELPDGTACYRASVMLPEGYCVYIHRPESIVTDGWLDWTGSILLLILLVTVVTGICSPLCAYMNYARSSRLLMKSQPSPLRWKAARCR